MKLLLKRCWKNKLAGLLVGELIINILLFNFSAKCEFLTFLDVNTTNIVGGGVLYQYTLLVLPESTGSALDLNLNLSHDVNPKSISSPYGWTAYHKSNPFFIWKIRPEGRAIQPGHSVSFSFISNSEPVDNFYSIDGIDLKDGAFSYKNRGKILTPGISELREPPVEDTGHIVIYDSGLCCPIPEPYIHSY